METGEEGGGVRLICFTQIGTYIREHISFTRARLICCRYLPLKLDTDRMGRHIHPSMTSQPVTTTKQSISMTSIFIESMKSHDQVRLSAFIDENSRIHILLFELLFVSICHIRKQLCVFVAKHALGLNDIDKVSYLKIKTRYQDINQILWDKLKQSIFQKNKTIIT